MRYSSLIRKLVEASAHTGSEDDDLVERLAHRCLFDSDPVRVALMNVVCDPRFKLHSSMSPLWKRMAVEALEEFALRLSSIDGLTHDDSISMLDEFLSWWLSKLLSENSPEESSVFYEPAILPPKRRRFERKIIGENIDADFSQLNASVHVWAEHRGDKDANKTDNKFNHAEDGTLSTASDSNGKSDVKNSGVGHGGDDLQKDAVVRFMRSVPPALIRVARKIGRVDMDAVTTDGYFMHAGKSDIVGITNGQDLSCVLPSELAILADTKTENIFYHKLTSRQLQLFASASSGTKSGRRHDNGPIVICLDTSSSMAGIPIQVATTLTYAVCAIAARRRRKVLVVKYAATQSLMSVTDFYSQLPQLSRFLSSVSMAANDENSMFAWLFNEVMPNEEDYTSADILCISDFGWIPIIDETMSIVNREKAKGMLFYGLNIGTDVHGMVGDYDRFFSPYDVCDVMWQYDEGTITQFSVCRS